MNDKLGLFSILIALIATLILLAFFWKIILFTIVITVVIILLIEITLKIIPKIKEISKSNKALKIDNFKFLLLDEVCSYCREKQGCKGAKLLNNLEKGYNITNCKFDNIEGMKAFTNVGEKEYSFPLSRINFVILFPKGFNWGDFLYLKKLETTNRVEYKKLSFVFNIPNKSNCWIILSNGEKLEKLELVDISRDGILAFFFKEQRLLYIPWKTIEVIGFSNEGTIEANLIKDTQILENFILIKTKRTPIMLIQEKNLSLINSISSSRENIELRGEDVW